MSRTCSRTTAIGFPEHFDPARNGDTAMPRRRSAENKDDARRGPARCPASRTRLARRPTECASRPLRRPQATFVFKLRSSETVKSFGCRPYEGWSRARGRRPKASRGGNRGNGYVGRCDGRYGDLGAARTTADGRRCDAASWWRVLRAMNERGTAMTAASRCAI